jgi:hypothetical protein
LTQFAGAASVRFASRFFLFCRFVLSIWQSLLLLSFVSVPILQSASSLVLLCQLAS